MSEQVVEIQRALDQLDKGLVRAKVFSGQGSSSSGEKGQNQAMQQEVVEAFSRNEYNTLVKFPHRTSTNAYAKRPQINTV